VKRFLILVFLTLITCMPVTGWGQEESQAEKPAEAQKEEKPIAVLPPIKVVAPPAPGAGRPGRVGHHHHPRRDRRRSRCWRV